MKATNRKSVDENLKFSSLKATNKEFKKFQELIEERIGIKFPETKRSLLESRLSGRINKMGFNSFEEYYNYLLNTAADDEFDFFVDKITTHTTHFFRENFHFEYLKDKGVEILNRNFNNQVIKILSLGASTGEEMYTLGMLFTEFHRTKRILDFEIHGADISKYALLKAKKGIFKIDHLDSIPKKYKNLFIIKEDIIEAKDILKRKLRFFVLNGSSENQKFPDKYHIIFCRNMLIYFNKELQQTVISNIESIIRQGGLIFIGHSESLHGLKFSFSKIAPTVYIGG